MKINKSKVSKIAFVTGAAGGIGSSLCIELATKYDQLVVLDKNENGLQILETKLINQFNCRPYLITCDITDNNRLSELISNFVASINKPNLLDIYICTGISETIDSIDLESSNVAIRNMMVNYIGVINTITPFLDLIRKSETTGSIVAITSNSALFTTRRSGEYSASKSALSSWLKMLQIQLEPYNFNVCNVMPGFVLTSMTKNNRHFMPGITSPEIIAKLIISNKKRLRVVIPKRAKLYSWLVHIMPLRLYIWLLTRIEGN